MENYKNIEEKSRFFTYERICDIDALTDKLEKLHQETPRNFYRGIDNASYKMYSSLQRKFEERKKITPSLTMPAFSAEILKKFNDSPVLSSAFKKEVESTGSDIAKWAFIQHFGGPSHLVDFTQDIYAALFFATGEGKKRMPWNNAADDLNNYISIYAFPDNPYITSNLNGMYDTGSETARRGVEKLLEECPDTNLRTEEVDAGMLTQPLEPELWGISVYGEKIFNVTIPGNGERVRQNYSNTHIRKQKGNFFVGKIDEVRPLEEAPYICGKCTNISEGGVSYHPIGTCIDIHKSLIHEIHKKFSIPKRRSIYTSNCYLWREKLELSELWLPQKKSQGTINCLSRYIKKEVYRIWGDIKNGL